MKHATRFRPLVLALTGLSCLALGGGLAAESAAQSPTAPPSSSSIAVPPAAQPSAGFGANLILNGDFENNTFPAGCHFNQSNAAVTAGVANVTAFGVGEIDVMNDGTSCGYSGPPQSGVTKLAIHRQAQQYGGYTDAFSFDLSSSVIAGATYTISFYAWANIDFDPDLGDVEIGLSNSATSFGSLVFSGTPITTGWTLLSGQFVAPLAASYLTVQVQLNTEGWNHIDNFSLEPVGPNAATQSSWGSVKGLYR